MVDDNRDATDSLALLLEMDGHQVLTAYNSMEALARCQAERPDVVLLDIGLPGMNGYSLARELRQSSELGRILLIAVTGYGQLEDKQKSQAAGFNAHLTKPVDIESLRKLLGDLPNCQNL